MLGVVVLVIIADQQSLEAVARIQTNWGEHFAPQAYFLAVKSSCCPPAVVAALSALKALLGNSQLSWPWDLHSLRGHTQVSPYLYRPQLYKLDTCDSLSGLAAIGTNMANNTSDHIASQQAQMPAHSKYYN